MNNTFGLYLRVDSHLRRVSEKFLDLTVREFVEVRLRRRVVYKVESNACQSIRSNRHREMNFIVKNIIKNEFFERNLRLNYGYAVASDLTVLFSGEEEVIFLSEHLAGGDNFTSAILGSCVIYDNLCVVRDFSVYRENFIGKVDSVKKFVSGYATAFERFGLISFE